MGHDWFFPVSTVRRHGAVIPLYKVTVFRDLEVVCDGVSSSSGCVEDITKHVQLWDRDRASCDSESPAFLSFDEEADGGSSSGVHAFSADGRDRGFDGFGGRKCIIDRQWLEGCLSVDTDGDLLIEAGGDDVYGLVAVWLPRALSEECLLIECEERGGVCLWIECESEGLVSDGDSQMDVSGWQSPLDSGFEHEVGDDEFGRGDE